MLYIYDIISTGAYLILIQLENLSFLYSERNIEDSKWTTDMFATWKYSGEFFLHNL